MADETVAGVVPVVPVVPAKESIPVDAYGFRVGSVLSKIADLLVNGGGKDKTRREVIETVKAWHGRTDGCVQAELHRVLTTLKSKGVEIKLKRSPRRVKPKAASAPATPAPAAPAPTA
jgi:hypothetical protein